MSNTSSIYRLTGVVQHYPWGGKHFLPALLNHGGIVEKPYAEYWLGAHANAPALVQTEAASEPLDRFIDTNPRVVLGNETNHHFGRLPFLLKVLDVKDMLSIQVHPSKKSAEEGFARDNQLGIASNAPDRNYKDDNHKPELMVALSEFWLLHGFKPEAEMRAMFDKVQELAFLKTAFEQTGYLGLYQVIMEMPQERVNEALEPLLSRIVPAYENNELEKSDVHFWAARAAKTYNQAGKTDRGIFSIYLFNLVRLKKFEGIFQNAGLPHAYLEGQNMEIMANSDNVLRGGLTTKHIDVPELLKHIRFEATHPAILQAVPSVVAGEDLYLSPAKEFQLSKFEIIDKGFAYFKTETAEIIFVYSGNIHFQSGENSLLLQKGEALFVTAGTELSMQGRPDCLIFRATVPIQAQQL